MTAVVALMERRVGSPVAVQVRGVLPPVADMVSETVVPAVGVWLPGLMVPGGERAEERRVGKECRSRGAPYHEKKKRRIVKGGGGAARGPGGGGERTAWGG